MSPQFMAWVPVNGGQEVGFGEALGETLQPQICGSSLVCGPLVHVCAHVCGCTLARTCVG